MVVPDPDVLGTSTYPDKSGRRALPKTAPDSSAFLEWYRDYRDTVAMHVAFAQGLRTYFPLG